MPRRARRAVLSVLFLTGAIIVGRVVFAPDEGKRDRPDENEPTTARTTPAVSAPSSVPAVPATTHPATATAAAPDANPAVIAFHELPVDVPLIAVAHHAGEPAALQSFRVRLGPDRFADVDVTRFDALTDEEGVYSGTVRGERDSQAVFSYVGLAHAGTVVLPGEEKAFYITATEHGVMRITELDLTRAPLCGQPMLAQGIPAAL